MACLGRAGRVSGFFLFSGTISYELYLLHGPFLVKYNPTFFLTTEYGLPLAVSFVALVAFVTGMATLLKKMGGKIGS